MFNIFITERRVKELVALEMVEHLNTIAKATAEAVYQNNRKIEQDLKDLGILK